MNLVQSQSFNFQLGDRDILAELLADKRSPETRRAYARDLKDFFLSVTNQEPSQALVTEFLTLDRFAAVSLVLRYKALLIEKGLKEATVNRRLAALRSLVKFAQKVGRCGWSLEEIEGEKLRQYRDTSGVDPDAYRAMLATCDRSTPRGLRNYAILRLLWDNALRRGEVSKCQVKDFNSAAGTLQILGKGRGTQVETINLSAATVAAIAAWLLTRTLESQEIPLFTALDRASQGHRLSGNALYEIVQDAAKSAGIAKRMSPHRVRHSSITAALDATEGNVREVQKLSRHRRLDTLMIYDDNRAGAQKKVTDLLSNLTQE